MPKTPDKETYKNVLKGSKINLSAQQNNYHQVSSQVTRRVFRTKFKVSVNEISSVAL